MIQARELTKSFGNTGALTGLDLDVPAGTITCLLGRNGAGKTTAVRVLATLLRPDAGWARVAGHDVVSDGHRVRERIGLSGQYASVDECLTGRANLVMIGALSRLPRRVARKRAVELLAVFDLEYAARRPVRTYSGGMRRKLDLAASLMARPSVLFLDEPTSGLDPSSRLTLWAIIGDLVAAGSTVLLTTQYLEEADRLADQICLIDGGRATAQGTPAELKESLGAAHLLLTVARGQSLATAQRALASFGAGTLLASAADRTIEMPVVPREGLVTQVIRALDEVGVEVDDIALRRPSLDEVFESLTRRAA